MASHGGGLRISMRIMVRFLRFLIPAGLRIRQVGYEDNRQRICQRSKQAFGSWHLHTFRFIAAQAVPCYGKPILGGTAAGHRPQYHPVSFKTGSADSDMGGGWRNRTAGWRYSKQPFTFRMPVSYTHLTLPTIYSV